MMDFVRELCAFREMNEAQDTLTRSIVTAFAIPKETLELATALDRFYSMVRQIGFDRERAEAILQRERKVSEGSPTLTWRDAIDRAERYVLWESRGY